jgi:hypothetical protein
MAIMRFGRSKIKIKITSSKLIDLSGQRFGRLRVVARSPSDKRGAARWFCRCDCGNGSLRQPVIVRADKLRLGETQSCGCLAVEKTLQRAKDRPKADPKPRAPRVPRSQPRLTSDADVSQLGSRSPHAGGPVVDWRQFRDEALKRALADLDAKAKARG